MRQEARSLDRMEGSGKKREIERPWGRLKGSKGSLPRAIDENEDSEVVRNGISLAQHLHGTSRMCPRLSPVPLAGVLVFALILMASLYSLCFMALTTRFRSI